MLRELHISNLAVIEDAAMELQPGLNVFTGETGAGKSLVIGAFELLLGLRAGGSDGAAMIRAGCEEARVSGLFEIHDENTARDIQKILDRSLPADEPLLVTRRLFATGRSSVSINGEPATAGMLREIGQYLVDIHGQNDQQYLLRPGNQLQILDAFAGSLELREKFAQGYQKLRDVKNKRQELLESQEIRSQQIELFEFQADEIDAAELKCGDFAEIQSRYVMLSNIGKLQQEAGQIYEGLYEAEGSAVERLQVICKRISELAELDAEKLADISQQIHDATEILRDSAYELNRYADGLELDPGELGECEERLDMLNHLIHKYGKNGPHATGDDPTLAVLAYREEIGSKLKILRAEVSDLGGLDAEIARLESQMMETGQKLSAERARAGKKLKPLIESQLKELGMAEATFDVALEKLDTPTGPSGLDAIEFLVRTNPGQDSQPLRKIASGGELSRIMLAIKSILAGSDRISVLVFDEIDANIGGRLGSVIGRKMRMLANGLSARPAQSTRQAPKVAMENGSGHQVLCITHLPQIAAFADNHLHIAKEMTGKGEKRQTKTTVKPLAGDARQAELAEMLAGKDFTPTALAQARELLNTAAS